jgi:hypothetical protein
MKERKRDKSKYYETENEDGETNERKNPKVCRQFIPQSFELNSNPLNPQMGLCAMYMKQI